MWQQRGNGRHIRVDQGLNTNKLDGSIKLSAELTEQQYLLSMDNRLIVTGKRVLKELAIIFPCF